MFRIKYSREIALKLLYQIDVLGLSGKSSEEVFRENLNFFKSVNKQEREFVLMILDRFLEKREQIDKLISENLIGWSLQRLTLVDRNLLRMGISESYFNEEKAIIIDDIVRIAKKYGEEDSFKIINAVLDKVIK